MIMLSSKARISWIKWHAYVSCFFLPFALLVAITGILYLFDIKGGASESFEYKISTDQVFPLEEKSAAQFMVNYFSENGLTQHLPLPDNYFLDHDVQGWWDFHSEVVLIPLEDNQLKVVLETNDFWRQMLYIHKGLAGKIFVVFGILFGISLLFSLISGTVVALVMPKLKKNAVVFMLGGGASLVFMYFIS